MVKQQYGPITYESNIDKLIQKFQGAVINIQEVGFNFRIWSRLEYAIYVEFGTRHIAPRAMIRRSMPNIKAFFETSFRQEYLFDKQKFINFRARVIGYALKEIKSRTPVKSGDLKASWHIGVDKDANSFGAMASTVSPSGAVEHFNRDGSAVDFG